MEIVGQMHFPDATLDVWDDLNEPLFLARDVAVLFYGEGRRSGTADLLRLVSTENIVTVKVHRSGQGRLMKFITEIGLYEAFGHSNHHLSSIWFDEMTKKFQQARRRLGKNFEDQVKYIDEQAEKDFWHDEENDIWHKKMVDKNGETYLEEL